MRYISAPVATSRRPLAALLAVLASLALGLTLVLAPTGAAASLERDGSPSAGLPFTAVAADGAVPASGLAVAGPPTATWHRGVWTTGGQRQIDQCRGAVRVPFSNGYAVVAEHNYCGGAWVLRVKVGQTIRLTGVVSGTFKAVAIKRVPVGASSNALRGMGTSGLVLQTCYFDSKTMRLVGLSRVPAPKLPATPAKKTAKPTCGGLTATIVGTRKADRIRGTAGRDVIVAGAGNDRIDGRGGHDVICAGPGNDTVYGGSGNDRIYGSTGHDRVLGGSGRDTIYGGSGNDRIYGNSGGDRLYGQGGNDRIDAGSASDTADGGSGHDRIWGSTGHDLLKGGSGNDRLWGGSGNDRVYGHSGRDLVYGGSGNDRLWGGSGNDRVYGHSGRDLVYGDSGNDRLWGGAGADVLSGGSGSDRLSR